MGLADRRVFLDSICGISGLRLLLARNIDVVFRHLNEYLLNKTGSDSIEEVAAAERFWKGSSRRDFW